MLAMVFPSRIKIRIDLQYNAWLVSKSATVSVVEKVA
jgi:hypothetical protein